MVTWNKVFESGSAKTGTTTLGAAFKILGLRQKGWDPELFSKYKIGDYTEILETVKHYDAFQDAPWNSLGMYKLFDNAFPNSKFILLERDLESWIRSYEDHFSADSKVSKVKDKIKPIENFEEKKQELIEKHITKYEEVKEYFRDRPNDLLVMNVCAGEGWEKLCPFLDLPIPTQPFPHRNKTYENTPNEPFMLKKSIRKLVQSIKRSVKL